MYAKRDGPGLTQVQFEDARPSPYDHVNPSYNVYYACIIHLLLPLLMDLQIEREKVEGSSLLGIWERNEWKE